MLKYQSIPIYSSRCLDIAIGMCRVQNVHHYAHHTHGLGVPCQGPYWSWTPQNTPQWKPSTTPPRWASTCDLCFCPNRSLSKETLPQDQHNLNGHLIIRIGPKFLQKYSTTLFNSPISNTFELHPWDCHTSRDGFPHNDYLIVNLIAHHISRTCYHINPFVSTSMDSKCGRTTMKRPYWKGFGAGWTVFSCHDSRDMERDCRIRTILPYRYRNWNQDRNCILNPWVDPWHAKI